MSNKYRHTEPKLTVCLRCGCVGGHSTADCNKEIPSISSLEQQIQQRLNYALSNVPPEWEKDEFGYALPNTNQPAIPDHQLNCANCGEFGHTANECDKPNKEELLLKFGDSINGKSQASREERENIVNWIKSTYYQDS